MGNGPEITRESLLKALDEVRKHASESAKLRCKPIRFKKDGPLIYPEKCVLLIPEKFKGTEVGDALTWLAWHKVQWLSGPLDTGDIFAVDAMKMDPFGYDKRYNLGVF